MSDGRKRRHKLLIAFLIALMIMSFCGCSEKMGKDDSRENGGISTINDFEGLRAGVMTGTPQAQFIQDSINNVQFSEFNDFSDMAIALRMDKIDFFVNSDVAFRFMQEQYSDFHMVDVSLKKIDIGAIFPKNSKGEALKSEFDDFIQRKRQDGYLDKLANEWLMPGEVNNLDIPSSGSKGTLKMVSCSGNKPFSYSLNNQMAGFDIALAVEFCKENGYGLQISDSNFAGMLSGIASEKYDFAAGQISWTAERAESVLYSDLYYTQNIKPIVRKSDADSPSGAELEFNTLDEINNAEVLGAVTGSILVDIYKEYYPNAKIMEFSSYSDMIIALKKKIIDAYVWDEPTAIYTAESNNDLGAIDELLMEEDYFFIFSKEEEALLFEFNNWVRDKRNTDYFEKLRDYWIETAEEEIKPVDYKSINGDKGTIRVYIADQARPSTYLKNREFTGYPLQVITDFARDSGYSLDVDMIDMSSAIVSVASNKADVFVSFVSKTEEREKEALFSDAIYSGGLACVVRKNNTEGNKEGFLAGLANSFRRTFIEEARWKLIGRGLLTTLIITVFGFLLANILGALTCYFAMSRIKALRIIAGGYSYIMQGTPMVVVLLMLFFIVFRNSDVSGVFVAIIGFGLVIGAYLGQTFEGAVRGVDKGQWEAAMAMGFSKPQIFMGIILPQMVRSMLPGYFSQLISLMKGTSIVGYIAVQDLTKAGDMIRSATFEAFFPLIFVALVYLLISCVILTILRLICRRLDYNYLRSRKQKDAVRRNA